MFKHFYVGPYRYLTPHHIETSSLKYLTLAPVAVAFIAVHQFILFFSAVSKSHSTDRVDPIYNHCPLTHPSSSSFLAIAANHPQP
jgi:hypothetical protein